MRTISDKQQKALKASTRRSLDMAGGAKPFSGVTRIRSEGTLSKYGSPNEEHEDTFMPIDVAVECDIEAGSPIILSSMAEMMGYVVVPRAELDAAMTDRISLVDALLVANEMGDVVRAITEALADNVVSAGERQEISREIDQAIKTLRDTLKKVGR